MSTPPYSLAVSTCIGGSKTKAIGSMGFNNDSLGYSPLMVRSHPHLSLIAWDLGIISAYGLCVFGKPLESFMV